MTDSVKLPSRTAKAKELLTGVKQVTIKKTRFNVDDVLYDVSKNQLLQIKRSYEYCYLCGGFTNYFNDAQTNTYWQTTYN